MDQAADWAKGKADSVASTMEPNVGRCLFTPYFRLLTLFQSQKSGSQRAGDAVSGNSNENKESLLDKAKNAVGMNDK